MRSSVCRSATSRSCSRTKEGVPDHYVDVFAGFILEGLWFQHFAIRTEARREDLLTTSTIIVEGRQEPAPATTDVMLVAIYGEGWRVPDPSFVFDLPAATGDRFHGWFAAYNVEREEWDDDFLLMPRDAPLPAAQISAFARTVHERPRRARRSWTSDAAWGPTPSPWPSSDVRRTQSTSPATPSLLPGPDWPTDRSTCRSRC